MFSLKNEQITSNTIVTLENLDAVLKYSALPVGESRDEVKKWLIQRYFNRELVGPMQTAGEIAMIAWHFLEGYQVVN